MLTNPDMMDSLIQRAVQAGPFEYDPNRLYIGAKNGRFIENNHHKILWIPNFLRSLYGEELIEGQPAYLYHAHQALDVHLTIDSGNIIAYHYEHATFPGVKPAVSIEEPIAAEES